MNRGPGLKELVAAAKPEECPFCGEPRKKREPGVPGVSQGRYAEGAPAGYYLTCGDYECAHTAYTRYWKRDFYRESRAALNAQKQAKKNHLSDPAGTRSAS